MRDDRCAGARIPLQSGECRASEAGIRSVERRSGVLARCVARARRRRGARSPRAGPRRSRWRWPRTPQAAPRRRSPPGSAAAWQQVSGRKPSQGASGAAEESAGAGWQQPCSSRAAACATFALAPRAQSPRRVAQRMRRTTASLITMAVSPLRGRRQPGRGRLPIGRSRARPEFPPAKRPRACGKVPARTLAVRGDRSGGVTMRSSWRGRLGTRITLAGIALAVVACAGGAGPREGAGPKVPSTPSELAVEAYVYAYPLLVFDRERQAQVTGARRQQSALDPHHHRDALLARRARAERRHRLDHRADRPAQRPAGALGAGQRRSLHAHRPARRLHERLCVARPTHRRQRGGPLRHRRADGSEFRLRRHHGEGADEPRVAARPGRGAG